MPSHTFAVHRAATPVPATDRHALLEAPRFGKVFTDHMVTIAYDGEGWRDAQVRPLESLSLHPATAVLHYAQEVFEGLKAHRQTSGAVVLFRPEDHAERFNRSLARMSMPELPTQLFVQSLRELVSLDAEWVPEAAGASLYLRPFMIATDTALGAGEPSRTYLFVVIASPSGPYFGSEPRAISVWLSQQFVRAADGGTGAAKTGGNYAGALLGLREAAVQGCDQAVWLDARERRYVEEAGAMNLFFVLGSGARARLVTPALTGTFLAGITRASILELAPSLGIPVEEATISVDDVRGWLEQGRLSEMFACGTAAIVAGIGRVRSPTDDLSVGDGAEGPVTRRIRDCLAAVQRGTRPDPFGWTHRVV